MFDLDVLGSNQIIVLCSTSHNGDHLCQLMKKFHRFKVIVQKIEWNKNPQRKANAAKLKKLQARFDWACSWTVLSSANYRPYPLAPE
jgi:hypothetical protein